MSTKNLLVELLVEELPPKALKKLGESFAHGIADSLRAQGLAGEHSTATPYASPRRLAVLVSAIRSEGEPQAVSIKLVPESIAYDAGGLPTPQLVSAITKKAGFPSFDAAKNLGAFVVRAEAGKRYVFHDTLAAGKPLALALQRALDDTIESLPIPKVMQYQLEDGWTSVNFVRPAHGLVALFGADVVPLRALGLVSGRETQGHRFEASMSPVVLQDADHYAHQLDVQGGVTASFASRHGEIVRQLNAAASREGLTPIDDAALLDEVTALVERPNVLLCQFEQEFLAVPQECLILTMKANQKYFPLLDAAGRLTNKFLVVSNIRPDDPSRVIEGNERVVRPRLADAKFFFDQDRKKTLESRVPGLDKVVYHGKLGSQGERVERLRVIAKWVAERIGADVNLADKAASLAKADLLTDMVGEFPELQGIMGGYYARHDGEDEQVAVAIEGQYLVRRDGTGDPDSPVAAALLVADRVETLVGIWAIGLKPTGDKDPYALRRHALGIISVFQLIGAAATMEGGSFKLKLGELLSMTATTFRAGTVTTEVLAEIELFIYDRYMAQLAPLYGARTVDAVVSKTPPLHEVVKRVMAVVDFQKLPEAVPLAAANKRVGNILRKSDADAVQAVVLVERLEEPAERALYQALRSVAPNSDAAFVAGRYAESLQALAPLKVPVDEFFDTVMVNADDPALRANRLGLLAQLHAAMNRVADLSKLAT